MIIKLEGAVEEIKFIWFFSVSGKKFEGWNEYILYGWLMSIIILQIAEGKMDFLNFLFEDRYILDIVGRDNVRNWKAIEETFEYFLI